MSQEPCPIRDRDTREHAEPHLRLLESPDAEAAPAGSAGHGVPKWDNSPLDYTAHVLIAGVDTVARAHLHDEMADQLPAGTSFTHASETWEVIAAASTSSMVVLAGDVGDMSGESMMRLLGRRYPTLPVLAVAEKTPTHTAADVDVAHA
jgi:hypothetical protein